eukprot:6182017-Pleurochrysis_carterae.AAC.2
MRVIEICDEQRTKAEERLKGMRREMSMTNNTDSLIQSLMSLGNGAGNMVTRVIDIVGKAWGDGANVQRGVTGVYQDDDKSKPIIRGPEIREEVHRIASKMNKADAQDVATVKEILRWIGLGGCEQTRKDRREEISKIFILTEHGRRALGRFQQHKGLGSDGFDGYLLRNATQDIQKI